MAIFKAFKPEGLAKIAKSMGYEGSLDNFSRFIEEKPERQVKAIAEAAWTDSVKTAYKTFKESKRIP